MMNSPSPQTAMKRPLQLCFSICGYNSHDPKSRGTTDKRSPSGRASSPDPTKPLTEVVWISLLVAHTTLPVASIEATGSSDPNSIQTHPSSKPIASLLLLGDAANAQARSIP